MGYENSISHENSWPMKIHGLFMGYENSISHENSWPMKIHGL